MEKPLPGRSSEVPAVVCENCCGMSLIAATGRRPSHLTLQHRCSVRRLSSIFTPRSFTSRYVNTESSSVLSDRSLPLVALTGIGGLGTTPIYALWDILELLTQLCPMATNWSSEKAGGKMFRSNRRHRFTESRIGVTA